MSNTTLFDLIFHTEASKVHKLWHLVRSPEGEVFVLASEPVFHGFVRELHIIPAGKKLPDRELDNHIRVLIRELGWEETRAWLSDLELIGPNGTYKTYDGLHWSLEQLKGWTPELQSHAAIAAFLDGKETP